MPDSKFQSMEHELLDAFREFEAHLRQQGYSRNQGGGETTFDHRMRGAMMFSQLLIGNPLPKGAKTPTAWEWK